jgi:hypothetical protein
LDDFWQPSSEDFSPNYNFCSGRFDFSMHRCMGSASPPRKAFRGDSIADCMVGVYDDEPLTSFGRALIRVMLCTVQSWRTTHVVRESESQRALNCRFRGTSFSTFQQVIYSGWLYV